MSLDTTYSTLLVQRRGDGVCWIGLNRPKLFNAVNMKMLSEVINAVKELDADPSVRVHVSSFPMCSLVLTHLSLLGCSIEQFIWAPQHKLLLSCQPTGI